jgi:hypothetical protein
MRVCMMNAPHGHNLMHDAYEPAAPPAAAAAVQTSTAQLDAATVHNS